MQCSADDHEYASSQYGWRVVVRDPPPHERSGKDECDPWWGRASNVQQFSVNALDTLLPLLRRLIPHRSTCLYRKKPRQALGIQKFSMGSTLAIHLHLRHASSTETPVD